MVLILHRRKPRLIYIVTVTGTHRGKKMERSYWFGFWFVTFLL